MAGALLCALTLVATPASALTPQGGCGDPDDSGSILAADALLTLQAAVGLGACDLARCDVDSSGSILAADALTVLKAAVGLVSSLDCPGVQVTSIGDLPNATARVASATGSSDSSLVYGRAAALQPRSLGLGDISQNAYDATDSMALCEMANRVKEAISSAAQADLLLCYIQNTMESNLDAGIDIYDGQHHTFGLTFAQTEGDSEEMNGPSRVRFKIGRDSEGSITEFEMFSCFDDGSGNETQNEYLNQQITGVEFSMLSKWIASESWGTYGHMAAVTGDLNDAGLFVGSKTINIADTGYDSWGNDSFSWQAQSTFVQTSSSIAVDGAETGTWNGSVDGMAVTASHSIRLVANANLEDSNVDGQDYTLTNLAIGHGAARARMDGTYTRDTTASQCESWQTDAGTNSGTGYLSCSESWGFDLTEGWNADDMSIDNDSTSGVAASHIAVVEAETLPDTLGSVSLSFDTSETYDCSDTIAATVTVDMDALGVACSQRLELDYDWVDCHRIMGDQHEDCEENECD